MTANMYMMYYLSLHGFINYLEQRWYSYIHILALGQYPTP